MKQSFSFATRALLVCVIALPGIQAPAFAKTAGVPVSIHGLNYTENEFEYSVNDPTDVQNSGGGEVIGPYASGGIMCCYTLPKTWRPGIKVQVNLSWYREKQAGGKLEEVPEKTIVEVPSYIDGKPGELWVIRMPDGKVDLVSSDYQPNHEKWPGKIKGWPVPSLEYQRERWDLYIKYEETGVNAYRSLIAELKNAPDINAAKAWELARQYDKKSLNGYTGPSDPGYIQKLKRDYEQGLKNAETKLRELKEKRP